MNIYICKYCTRKTSNIGANARHEKHCQDNPDRIKAVRSPNAGVKKGNIPWNKGKNIELTDYQQSIRRCDEDVFVEKSTYARHRLKKRIIDQKMIPYICDCCGIGPLWNGKPMPLILDHINGINNDNRLENLRFVCSNCDSQLPTYKAKNKNNGSVAESG
jgi:hypothetical protein